MNDISFNVSDKPDEELLKMVYEFDQWSPGMLHAVEEELSKRNILPTDIAEKKQTLSDNETMALKEGKDASVAGLAVGWLTVFGLLGIAIGYNYAYSKIKSKYTGETYYKYNATSRRNGTNLFYASILLSIVALVYRIVVKNGVNI